MAIKITLTSVMVDDQAKALTFYTEVLGFAKKTDLPAGDARWLTVVSPAASADIELALEPIGYPFARRYQEALFEAGIPLTAFAVDDIQAEYERMKGLGVVFRGEPTTTEGLATVVFEDTCGNLIMLFQV